MKVSVLISIYSKERPDYFKQALESIGCAQTVIPDEIVVVQDGPIGNNLNTVLIDFKQKYSGILKIVGYSTNKGLGYALNYGLKECTHNIVLRMDSDDIAFNNRIELQKLIFSENPSIDICGMQIEEFDENGKTYVRKVPSSKASIIKYSKIRNPLNHVTVGFKRDKILSLGSYKEMMYFEDYYLWLRCIKNGYNIINIPKNGVMVRAGIDMIGRRRGIAYIKHEFNFFSRCQKEGLISRFHLIRALIMRIPPRLLGPYLNLIYTKLLR